MIKRVFELFEVPKFNSVIELMAWRQTVVSAIKRECIRDVSIATLFLVAPALFFLEICPQSVDLAFVGGYVAVVVFLLGCRDILRIIWLESMYLSQRHKLEG